MKKFNAQLATQIDDEIQEAIKSVLKKHGLEARSTSRTYYDDRLPVKLELTFKNHKVDTKGLTDSDVKSGNARPGTKLLCNGEIVTIVKSAQKRYQFTIDSDNSSQIWTNYFQNFKLIK